MDRFDVTILHFLNQFAQRSDHFDKLVGLLFGNLLLEGGVMMSMLWWAWFRPSQTQKRDREIVVMGIGMCVVALVVTRLIAIAVGYRERPRYVEALHFKLPSGSAGYDMIKWSSFPSDHACLYFFMATTLFFISKKVGVFAYFHAFFVVCLTRMYLGIHYPTDILVGILLGVGFALLSLNNRLRTWIAAPPMRWFEERPTAFYPAFFLCTMVIATEFDPLRELLVDMWKIVHGPTHG